MKYKAKFNATPEPHYSGYTSKVDPEFTYNDEDRKGVFVFIPFTDTRFFEPVKTRKFQVEVSEENMERFNFYVNDGDEHWTVTEITENKYLEALKANREVAPQVIETMSQFDYVDLAYHAFTRMVNEHGKNVKLRVVKDMKDYLNSKFITINGLKNAKDIVDSWWNL